MTKMIALAPLLFGAQACTRQVEAPHPPQATAPSAAPETPGDEGVGAANSVAPMIGFVARTAAFDIPTTTGTLSIQNGCLIFKSDQAADAVLVFAEGDAVWDVATQSLGHRGRSTKLGEIFVTDGIVQTPGELERFVGDIGLEACGATSFFVVNDHVILVAP